MVDTLLRGENAGEHCYTFVIVLTRKQGGVVHTVIIVYSSLCGSIEAKLVIRVLFDIDTPPLCKSSIAGQWLENIVLFVVVRLDVVDLFLRFARWAGLEGIWILCSASQPHISHVNALHNSPFSLFRLTFTGPGCEDSGSGCGLEDWTGKLLGTGVASALDGGSLRAVLKDGGFGCDAMLDGAGPGVLLKKPAMLCCLEPDFCMEPPVFLGAARGVAISLPSIPRAIS